VSTSISRRGFLQAGGALVVAFSWPATVAAEALRQRGGGNAAPEPGVPAGDALDSWLAVDSHGQVTLFSGKVELGTGVQTALAQIVAEELDIDVSRVHVIQGETGRVPNQGPTVGSKTIQIGGVQIRKAAAEARQALLELAAARFGLASGGAASAVAGLTIANGVISAAGQKPIAYADLIGEKQFNRRVSANVALKKPERYTVVGKPVPRIELPAKVYGTHEYVQNIRVPGMLHGRVIRPNAIGATVDAIDEASVRSLPGFVAVIHRGSFVGIVAEREEQAIAIASQLAVTWIAPSTPLPDVGDLEKTLRAMPGTERVLANDGAVDRAFTGDLSAAAAAGANAATGTAAAAARAGGAAGVAAAAAAAAPRTLQATYSMPYQSHGSIGPSCAVADVRDGAATVWSGTQGSYSLRSALADLLGLPAERVRVVWTEASGCYGHNGADDAAADAALLSQATGKPVRVQWSRRDEHGWDPKGPAMLMDVRGALDAAGHVVAWDYRVLTTTHATRPGGNASNLLAAQLVRQRPPQLGTTGGDRNARHSYTFPNNRVAVRWLEQSVIRPSAFRGLGAPANVFAIESFVDELATAARVDPVQFRLRALKDPRAIAVVERVAALAAWKPRAVAASAGHAGTSGTNHTSRSTTSNNGHGHDNSNSSAGTADIATGRGIAYLQYENENTYVATVAEVAVNRRTGVIRVTRVFVAHDCGLIINPDGLRNQIEGGTIQTISRTLKEQVQWDRAGVTTLDWASYPLLTFAEVPETITIALIDHPDLPALGAGEAAACAVPAAIANAVCDATGVRFRNIPFTPARVLAALAQPATAAAAGA
jgi:nicotinate dehydrogenase subunit B